MIFNEVLYQIAEGRHLSAEQAHCAFSYLMAGEASEAQIAALLMGLRQKGETSTEITAAALVMRHHMNQVGSVPEAMDVCGTGGDGKGTLNISTAVAIILAGAGVQIAKHGNRALTSKSGSSEVLEALGVRLDLTPDRIAECMESVGIGFMFAPAHHPATRHVMPVRTALRPVRTVFNLIGPLCNPAGVERQLLGVYAKDWVEPMAEVLLQLGTKAAWVIHGEDGLDELSISTKSYVSALKDGRIESFETSPEDAGLSYHDEADILGGTPEENAEALRGLLAGEKGAYRDIVLFNAAAGFMVAEKATSLKDGVEIAANTLDEGKALAKLESLVHFTQQASYDG